LAPERPSAAELLAAGGERTWASTGSAIAKPIDAARSAGTLEMHPIFAQGLEPAFPCLGQHGCESAAGWETMAAHATGAKPITRIRPRAVIACARVHFVLARLLIASHNIARCEPKFGRFQVLGNGLDRLGAGTRLRHLARTSASDILSSSPCLFTSKSALSVPPMHRRFGSSVSLP